MNFRKLIDELAAAPHAHEKLLTDGRFTVSYARIPEALDRIDRRFQEQGIRPTDELAFTCINSLAGALTLLYLLRNGRRFLLMPATGDRERAQILHPIPRFCRYHVEVARVGAKKQPELDEPRNFLRFEHNPRFETARRDDSDAGRLYLRTSGSMGASKIAVFTHEKLLGNARNCAERFAIEGCDRVSIPVPIFHMYGLGAGFLSAFSVGASIDLQDNSNVLRYLDRERAFRPTVAFLIPSFCEMLLSTCKSNRSYKRVVTATQRIREDTFRKFDARFGGLINLYGSTEMGAIAACEPDASVEVRATSIGKPMSGVELSIGDPDPATPITPTGGELHCRHRFGFEGYIDAKGDWIRRMLPNEWYRTGDRGTADCNGRILIAGRVDNSVNRDGHLILFSEIEQALEGLECIEQAVIVAIEAEDTRGQRLAVFCALKPPTILNDTQIRDACFKCLPRHAVPDQVIVIKTWPTLPSGKVDRQALMALAG